MPYNTVPYHGKVCQVEKNNVAMDFGTGWNLDVALDVAEANRAGQNWKEALPGQAGWNGSFSGQFVAGNTEQKAFVDNIIAAAPGTKLTDVKFLLDGATNAFTGNIFITGFSINPGIGGVVTCSFNYQGDGALTLTNAA